MKSCCKFLEGTRLVHFIVVFNIWHVFHGNGPELFKCAITQNMVLKSRAQLVNRYVIKNVINNDVINLVGNFEGVIKTSGSTLIDKDGQFDFVGGSACSSGNSTKKNDQFVVGRGVVDITIEVSDIVVERRFDVMVANIHG